VTYQENRVERLLSRFNVFPFRCQLCTNRFRAFESGARHNTQAFDRRQYARLKASIDALIFDHKQLPVTNRITDISMDGCTLQTTGFPKGSFIELVLRPAVEEDTIRIETALFAPFARCRWGSASWRFRLNITAVWLRSSSGFLSVKALIPRSTGSPHYS
jgi:hypothetical protein